MIIYKATNKINGKICIGRTIRSFEERKKEHIRKAIRKYRPDKFEWEILVETDSESKLIVLEKFYIMTYRKTSNLYNILSGGEKSPMQGRQHTDAAKKRMSNFAKQRRHSEETKAKIGKAGLGRIVSEETRDKMRGEKNPAKRKEIRAKLSGKNNYFYGKHFFGKDNPMWGKKRPDLVERNKRTAQLRKANNTTMNIAVNI